ncbi:hypothetical protein PILCRDRAFT_543941 [Piloderma croceum F 1598]|uniref:Importin N-terminal domain-containing protein n=1 Tax=Piloderma croceum (strain F 1598) TaxID=765440 RepID=A0A0C3BRW9_PILCF|nr:hypothetical protein PILCRDRAFT_543941 [Piloderma croceum F 1598]
MDSVVPPNVIADLTQILGNLMLSDNAIRSNAEKTLNDCLRQTPELCLLGLTQIAVSADTDVTRSFSLVLLRRFLFHLSSAKLQPTASPAGQAPRATFLDKLSSDTHSTIKLLLLHSFSHEPAPIVRNATVEAITVYANHLAQKGQPWEALQAQAFNMTQSQNAALRESAFRLFVGTRMLGIEQTDTVLTVLKDGLEDKESIHVRLWALRASEAFLLSFDNHMVAQPVSLLLPMLDTLSSVPQSHFSEFISSMYRLAKHKPGLFQPHLQPLLNFLRPRILPSTYSVSTPTESNPTPSGASTHSSTECKSLGTDIDELGEEEEAIMKAALEFMITLSEAGSTMVTEVDGWVAAIVRGCLEGMGTLRNDDLDEWLEANAIDDVMSDEYARICEQSLHRLSAAVKGQPLLQHAFVYIPGMLVNADWRLRQAGLAAMAQVLIVNYLLVVTPEELAKVLEMATPLFNDPHPRVRYAACKLVKQLCVDIYQVMPNTYSKQLFVLLIPMLGAQEPRVQSQAASTLIRLCNGISSADLIPYLDTIVERLLKLLTPTDDNFKEPKRYFQEEIMSVFTAVIKTSQAMFTKHYSNVMPLLLNALRNATGADSQQLRAKVLECAGFAAAAVGPDVFRSHAGELAELMMQIQNGTPDVMLDDQLIVTWGNICQATRAEFEPYLPVVIPPLFKALSVDESGINDLQAFVSRYLEQKGMIGAISTDNKRQAFQSLIIYCATLQARFAPYVPQSLELTLSALRHSTAIQVQEECISLIPLLLSCGKDSGNLTAQMITASFHQLSSLIRSETEPTFLMPLFQSFTSSVEALGGPAALPREAHDGLMESLTLQLENLAATRKKRTPIPEVSPAIDFEFDVTDLNMVKSNLKNIVEPTGLDLISMDPDEITEDMETLALKEMTQLLSYLDPMHPLLANVITVQSLGRNRGIKHQDDMMRSSEEFTQKLTFLFGPGRDGGEPIE